jgi:hypothetical protein
MSQTAYTNGQTAFTLTNIIDRVKKQNTELTKGTPDFLGAAQLTLAAYAATYTGPYYDMPSQTSAPTAFPAVTGAAGTRGSFYEIAYPSDAQDGQIKAIEVHWDTSNLKTIEQTLIVEDDEVNWDTASTNTTTVYWVQAGRKIRIYVPVSYLGTAPKYTLSYKRLPTYPGVVGDTLDVPAEDFAEFYSQWVANIVAD